MPDACQNRRSTTVNSGDAGPCATGDKQRARRSTPTPLLKHRGFPSELAFEVLHSARGTSEGQVVGQDAKCLVMAEGTYGTKVPAIQREDRVGVVVGRQCDVHHVGEIKVERQIAGPD